MWFLPGPAHVNLPRRLGVMNSAGKRRSFPFSQPRVLSLIYRILLSNS